MGAFASLIVAAERARSAAGPQPTASGQKRVLALFDFEKHSPANVIWDATLRETLQAGRPNAVEYYAEFFDASRFDGPEHLAVMHDYLRRKYAGVAIDVVVAMDLASRFMLGQGHDLFVGVPDGAYRRAWPSLRSPGQRPAPGRHSGRVRRAQHGRDGAAAASRDHGGRDRLQRDRDREILRHRGAPTARDLRRPRQADLPVFASLEELRSRTAKLGSTRLVLFVVSYDPNDEAYAGRYPSDIATAIAHNSGAPVYGLYSSYLRDGVVGGHVYSLEAAATIAGARPSASSRVSGPRTSARWRRRSFRCSTGASCGAGASTRRGCRPAARFCIDR